MIPFPEHDLKRLAEYHESVAASIAKEIGSAFFTGVHMDRAKVCRDALQTHLELRERFLEQSMRVRELEAKLPKVA